MNRELFSQYARLCEQEARIGQLHQAKLHLLPPSEPHLQRTHQSLLQTIQTQLTGIGAAREALENHPEFLPTVTKLLAPVAMAIICYTDDRGRYEEAYEQARGVWKDAEEEGLKLPDDLESHIKDDLMQTNVSPPVPVDPIAVLQNTYSDENPGLNTLSDAEQKALVDLYENKKALPPVFHQAANDELVPKTLHTRESPTTIYNSLPIKDVMKEEGEYTALPHIIEQMAIMFINGERLDREQVGARLVEKGIISASQWAMVGEMLFAHAQSEINGYFKQEHVSTHWETTTRPGRTLHQLIIDHNPHTVHPASSDPTELAPSSIASAQTPIAQDSVDTVTESRKQAATVDSTEWMNLESLAPDPEYAINEEVAQRAPIKNVPETGITAETMQDETHEHEPDVSLGTIGDAILAFPEGQLAESEAFATMETGYYRSAHEIYPTSEEEGRRYVLIPRRSAVLLNLADGSRIIVRSIAGKSGDEGDTKKARRVEVIHGRTLDPNKNQLVDERVHKIGLFPTDTEAGADVTLPNDTNIKVVTLEPSNIQATLAQYRRAQEISLPDEAQAPPDIDLSDEDVAASNKGSSEETCALSPIAAAILDIAKSGTEIGTADIQNHLLSGGYMTEDEWRRRNPTFITKIQREIVAHLNAQGIRADWDYQGNTRARKHSLYISTESSDPEALEQLLPTNKEEVTEDTPTIPIRPVQRAATHMTADQTNRPRHTRTQTLETRLIAVQKERQLGHERAAVVRDLKEHMATISQEERPDNRWNAIVRSLSQQHPDIDVGKIIDGLVEQGEYHIVRSNGSKLLAIGAAPETAPYAPRKGMEQTNKPEVDLVGENPDVASAVVQELATRFTHHSQGETMRALFDTNGDGMTEDEFRRMIRQMAGRGLLILDSSGNYGRARKGTLVRLPDPNIKRVIAHDPASASDYIINAGE